MVFRAARLSPRQFDVHARVLPLDLREVSGRRVLVLSLGDLFDGAGASVRATLASALAAGPLDAVVLDLRDDGGGSLREAAAVAGAFLDDGVVATVVGRGGEAAPLLVPGVGAAWAGPLVVSVDEGTASAAELLAGALQERGRALVAGAARTYGKGTVQVAFGADDGVRGGEAIVTTAYFLLPSGRPVQQAGVIADVVVPGPAAVAGPREADLPLALAPPSARSKQARAEGVAPSRLTALQAGVVERHGPHALLSRAAQLDDIVCVAAEWATREP